MVWGLGGSLTPATSALRTSASAMRATASLASQPALLKYL